MQYERTYPVCLKHGRHVTPDDVERGDKDLTCLGCNNRMLVRKGQIKVHHFAHYPDFEGTCNGETALHLAAKQAIHDGFNDAKASSQKYLLVCMCLGCFHYYNYDLTDQADRVVLEQSLAGSNIRPDVTFLTGDGKPLITVEVVVSHSPEPETLEEYARLEIPTFEVKPTWDAIKQFRTMHIAASHHLSDSFKISIDELTCSYCRKQKEEHEKALEAQEKAVQRAVEDELKALEEKQMALEEARKEKERKRLITASKRVDNSKRDIVDAFNANKAKTNGSYLIRWKCIKGHLAPLNLIGNWVAVDKQLSSSFTPDITFFADEQLTKPFLHIEVLAPPDLTQPAIDEYTSLEVPVAVVDPENVSRIFKKIFCHRVFNMPEFYNIPDQTCFICNPPKRQWIPGPSGRRSPSRSPMKIRSAWKRPGGGFRGKRR